MRVDVGTTINRPIDEVFAFMSDPNKHAEWVEPVLSDTDIASGPVHEGTTFHETAKLLGRHIASDWTVTNYQPPHTFEQQTTIGGTKMKIGMTLNSEGQGTRVEMVTEAEGDTSGLAHRLFRLGDSVVAGVIKHQQQADLETLKLVLENQPS
jgi:carbon monoxide dehydrogenase subunit G